MTSRSQTGRLRRRSVQAAVGLAVAVSLVPVGTATAAVTQGAGCTDAGATVSCEFWATSGSVTLPGSNVAVMGYSSTAGGTPSLPGPAIVADEGDIVEVTLHNELTVATGLLFQEQTVPIDRIGVAAGATTTYRFTATTPGTYLYEASPFVPGTSGGGSQYQTAMGMSGALVVHPTTSGRAYPDAESAFDAEHLVVISELDTALTAANAATFDMRAYAPDFVLVNGAVAPDTAALPATQGDRVLLRWVNAGVRAHSAAVLGARQRVVGEDGNALANPRSMVAETLGAGQTEDAIVPLPANASGKFPVYDAGLSFNNNTAPGTGGALTFIDVAPSGASPDQSGPGTHVVRFTDPTLSATISDVATGGANVSGAEYFVDTVGANGTGVPLTGTFDGPTVDVSATVSTLSPGNHTIYVHGKDAVDNWGPVSSVIYVNADTTGPATKGLRITPDPTNGTKALALDATGDDRATGGSAVTDAEYAIDGGAPTGYSSNGAGSVAALDTTIPAPTVAALSEGAHQVTVRSRDAVGNWGAPASTTITIDTTGPAGSAPSTKPEASNGVLGVSPTTPAVRVGATFVDPTIASVQSGVAAGEGFIDATAAADGTGFPLVPLDGTFGGAEETLRSDVPLTTIIALTEGNHTFYLHARDASGNWGPKIGTPLLVDKHAPVVTGVTATPNPTNTVASNNRTFALAAVATDNLTAVTHAEWFTGSDPGAGNATRMTVTGGPGVWNLSAIVDVTALGWLDGARTISVRSRDAAGNWSTPVPVTVTVVRPNEIFRDGFESGNGSAWSGRTGTGRIAYVAAANMAGTGSRGMRVTMSGTINAANPAGAYVTDNAPVSEPTYHARFYINPNGSTPGGGANGVTLMRAFAANNGGGATLFTVSYRTNGTSRQVRLGVTRVGGTTTTNWFTIPGASATAVEVFWQAGASTSSTLSIAGVPVQTLTRLNTGAASRIESLRLGVQGLTGANATRSGSVYLDSFVSTRRTVVGR